jgi:hypothetical protein
MGDEPKTVTIWDGIIEYEQPVPDAETQAVNAAIEADLAAFDQHKNDLLNILRDVHERGPKSEPFDADKSWLNLTTLASVYVWRKAAKQQMKHEIIPAVDRKARLHELTKALGRARRLVNRAMRDAVGDDLYSAWWDKEDPPPTRVVVHNEDGSLSLVDNDEDDDFKEAVAGLAALETAALRAADDVPTRGGRPAILPREEIEALAAVYRNRTGSKPGSGDGPFARLVFGFLIALGRDDIADESVIDAIKDTRARVRMRPAASRWGPSPFDEEA